MKWLNLGWRGSQEKLDKRRGRKRRKKERLDSTFWVTVSLVRLNVLGCPEAACQAQWHPSRWRQSWGPWLVEWPDTETPTPILFCAVPNGKREEPFPPIKVHWRPTVVWEAVPLASSTSVRTQAGQGVTHSYDRGMWWGTVASGEARPIWRQLLRKWMHKQVSSVIKTPWECVRQKMTPAFLEFTMQWRKSSKTTDDEGTIYMYVLYR